MSLSLLSSWFCYSMKTVVIQLILALLGSSLAKPLFSPAEPFEIFKRASSGCSTSGAASCSSSAKGTCCFEAPGGLLLQTQFWDTDPSSPTNSWTIHGLWPDNCDGTFTENCDSSRDYTGISSLLTAQGASDTLSFMNQFWINDPDDGSNEEFWEHEWATHGTCYSTLEPSCLPSGSPRGAEAVAFFETVVRLFKTLPTYDFLAAADITPSSSKTYTLSNILAALKSATGVTPALDCDGSKLSQISWYFNVKGSVIDGTFVPIDAPSAGSCKSGSLSYPTKTGTPVATTTTIGTHTSTKTTATGTPTGAPGSIPTKGTIVAVTSSGATTGGLLTAGTWSTQTLATYTFSGSASSFTLKTSKGSCGVSGGKFACGSGVSATSFSAVSSGGNTLVASGGSTQFSSDGVPSGDDQETVFTGSGHSHLFNLGIVAS
ncbi:hypothetical protein PLICRDRAFT_398873 [Plicaturopsis crispa FD-325 SS-3]|nr:hypothetical protein PLICRDRAFT_398873 [Plicaturopsis crispa FD-325 SS-3]